MSVKFFGQFLIEKGVITRKQLLEAVEFQKNVNIKLGTLAIDKGLMNHSQVQEIIELQKRHNKYFGELSIEKGFLNKKQLEDLLNHQKSDRVYLGEALVEKGFLTLKELEDNLKEYSETQEKNMEIIMDSLKNIENVRHLNIMISVTLNLMRRVVDITAKIGGCQKNHISQRNLSFSVSQRIRGDISGVFVLSFSKDVFNSIATKMLKTHVEDVDDISIDAVKEFVNVVVGHICANLSAEGMMADATPPELFELDKSGKDAAEKGVSPKDVSVIPLILPDETMEMVFLAV
jgi:CheY-specific phosphatase CheX